MAHISNLAYTNDETCIENNEGFLNAANFPNPSTETQTRTQMQKMLSQIRKYMNETVVAKINGMDDSVVSATVNGTTLELTKGTSND